jgi:ABC-type uncharacterized transport system permease subunit
MSPDRRRTYRPPRDRREVLIAAAAVAAILAFTAVMVWVLGPHPSGSSSPSSPAPIPTSTATTPSSTATSPTGSTPSST